MLVRKECQKGCPAATSGSTVSWIQKEIPAQSPLDHSDRIGTSPTLRKHPKSSYEKFADKVRRKGQVRVLDGGKRCWEGSVVRIAGIPCVYKYNSISSIKPDSQTTGKSRNRQIYGYGWGQAGRFGASSDRAVSTRGVLVTAFTWPFLNAPSTASNRTQCERWSKKSTRPNVREQKPSGFLTSGGWCIIASGTTFKYKGCCDSALCIWCRQESQIQVQTYLRTFLNVVENSMNQKISPTHFRFWISVQCVTGEMHS